MKKSYVVTASKLLAIVMAGVLCVLELAGCGGGGSAGAPATSPPSGVAPGQPQPDPPAQPGNSIPGGLWQADSSVLPQTGNYIYLKSDKGDLAPDFIGAGQTYLYSEKNNDEIYVEIVDGVLKFWALTPRLDYLWTGTFQGVGPLKQLQTGYYPNAHRYPFQNAATESGLDIVHQELQRACNQVVGWFTVDKIEYANNKPASVDLRFEQHCEGNALALHGQIHWIFDTTPQPLPGPTAPPSNLWRADPSVLPATGNYAYFKSDLGSPGAVYGGDAVERLYTSRDALFKVYSYTPDNIAFYIDGDQHWQGSFQVPAGVARIQPGYYGDIGAGMNPDRGMLKWGDVSAPPAGGIPGKAYPSWIVVDKVAYDGDTLVALDARFEIHGGGMRPALRGQYHWDAKDATQPPGPVNPPPADFWRPPAAAVPASGNYVYLQSDPNDFIGAGQTYLYTAANAEVIMFNAPEGLQVKVNGDTLWVGTFKSADSARQLLPGYYAGVLGINGYNPTKGLMEWWGSGRACNQLISWFVVDSVTYTPSGQPASLEARFEQHCEYSSAALRGAIHWAL